MTDASALWANDTALNRSTMKTADVLKTGTAAAKVHPFKMVLDFKKIARGPGKLTFEEYVKYRLYDRTLFPDNDARLRFLSDRQHWALTYQCSDRDWNATTQDKWISEVLLREAELRTTRTLALVGGAPRSYGRTPHLNDGDKFAAFMGAQTAPIFAKVNGGQGSEGATRITPLGDGRYDVAGVGQIGADELYSVLCAAPGAYLLQEDLEHHPDMQALVGDRIATIRAISFVLDGKVHTPLTVMKMPSGGNIADNYWRSGNLIADIDETSGRIRRAVRGTGPKLEEVSHHADTGAALIGTVLPMWSEVMELTRATGELYAPVKYQSLDIAITKDGPAVVEVNTGSSFTLTQIARGEGFLSNEVLDLFMRAGAKFDTKKLNLA